MAMTFYLRGTSKSAFYTGGFKTPNEYGTNSVDVGDIDHVINLDQGSFAQHCLHFDGRLALPTTQQWSILMRVASGSTTDANQMFYIGGGCNFYGMQARFSGTGTIPFTLIDATGTTITSQTFTFAYAAGTYYDLVWTVDTSLTTNAINLWKDGSNVATTSAAATRAALPGQFGLQILIGSQNTAAQNSTRLKVSEVAIWDTIINPTSIALTSGTGSLNGASRTAYLSASSFEGLSYTDPGVSNVRLNTTYTFAGTSETGTQAIPTAGNVRSGTATGSTTGTLAVPSANDVRNGVSVDAGTGNLVVPTASTVKTGTTYDSNSSVTGTYDGSDRWTDPGIDNVRNGTTYKANSTSVNKTGDLVVPAASNVKQGVTYDSNSSVTGTYSASCDYPVVSNVKLGVLYSNGTLTGTYNPLGVGSGIGPAAQLSERTRKLILALIKANISTELAAIRTDRNDPSVNTEPPPSQSYFIYPEAHDYQMPAIFCVVDSGEIEDSKDGKNYVSANMKIYVSAVVGGQTAGSVTVRCDRYQAALFKILHQAVVVDQTDNVKIHIYVRRIQFGSLYTVSRKKDNMSDFRKEVALELEVKHWENPIS